MKFQVLISTMNKKNREDIKSLLKKMNIKRNYYIVNQSSHSDIPCIYHTENGEVYTYNEKGLSRSRNRCLFESKNDICLISDENVTYVDNFDNIIINQFIKHKEYDVIAFYVGNAKPINNLKNGKVNLLNSMKLCSVQIAFRKKSIIEKNIQFDERFGTGSNLYKSGEENIFLADCIKNKLKIYYCPIKIGILNEHKSTWFKGFNEEYFVSKGACYKRIFRKMAIFINIQFLIRKYKLYKKNISFFKAYKAMNEGCRQINKKIFLVGDFFSNTGPANANKSLLKVNNGFLKYSIRKNKITRVIEMIFKIINSDIICFCSYSRINIIGVRLCKILNKKTIYLMHGYLKEEQKYREISNKDILIEDEILNNVNKIICVSKKYNDILKTINPKLSIDYVFNGVNSINIFNEDIKRMKKNEKKFTIVSTGGDNIQKNNIKICEAIYLNEELKNKVRYIIIGEIENKSILNQYKFVKCKGKIEHKECIKIMANANLYIQNSYIDSFGLATIEALLAGCDILISSNVGAIDILNLNQFSIIQENEDINEISEKILYKIKNNNYNEIINKFDIYINDYRYRTFELLRKMEN